MTPIAPPQAGTPFQQLIRLYHIITPLFEQVVGISVARWRVLISLYNHGQMSQSELQQHLQVDPAAITRQAKQLEEEGLIRRWANPQDNRSILVVLTESGRELVANLIERRNHFESEVMHNISREDLDVMERCLAQIRTNVRTLGETLA